MTTSLDIPILRHGPVVPAITHTLLQRTRRALVMLAGLMLSGLAMAAVAVDEPGPIASAPPWSLKTPDGRTVNYPADAQGRPTVLMFWPSWCPFSRALQPYVQDIWHDYRNAGVNVWTINIKESGDPVQTMRERGLSFPLLLDGDPLVNTYKIQRTPWLVVIDGKQHIVYTRPANPPTPIDVAKRVREALNQLLGDKAVPLPGSYPPPYDLHLRKAEDLPDRLNVKSIADSEWEPWVQNYLAGLGAEEAVKDIPSRGPLANGKAAIALAKELWSQRYGAGEVDAQAPYRAFRKGARWIVLGQGLDKALGEGLILVVEADTGQVVRLVRAEPAP
ncbi:MAG: NTF2 fold immunity protein [Panacagrimonas sp.]